ncbi:hypothetical protein [Lewinella sp. IMCC34191]|uniref:hypothetical protein n=1 Tax=Lewinella sp. IMCC34191 TaxID=2259172 RepID=UPI000E233F2B|nr:hypothetical protein [Lewinella sp. IMCC34191]
MIFIKKYFVCKFCHESTYVATSATDRVDLERERGERFSANCAHCHKPGSIHVNQILAKPNPVITVIGGVAGLVATAALWNVGFIAYAAGALPVIVYQAQAKSAQTFNSYKITPSRK